MSTLLDFEKPLEELHEQLSQARKIAEKGKVNVDAVIKDLEAKIEHTRKELYTHLTAWQRVQLSRHPSALTHSIILMLLPMAVSLSSLATDK